MMDNKRIIRNFVIVGVLLLIIVYCALTLGELKITPEQIKNALLTNEDGFVSVVLKTVRIPRILTALSVGAGLSVSGYLMKLVLKNPIADSGILGIQSGASTFALGVMLLIPALFPILPFVAFLGGMCTFFLLILLSYHNQKLSSLAMILTGVALMAFFTAINGIIQTLHKDKIQYTLGWLSGSIANVTVKNAYIITTLTIIFCIITLCCIPILKLLRLDDVTIRNLGRNPYLLRFIITVIAVFLACISVSYVGVIGFIGIIVPYIAKKCVGTNDVHVIIMTMLIGGGLLLLSDLVQKLIFSPQEIPVGIIIGLFGTPFFIILMRSQRNEEI